MNLLYCGGNRLINFDIEVIWRANLFSGSSVNNCYLESSIETAIHAASCKEWLKIHLEFQT